MPNLSKISARIKKEALRLGFSACGIAKAEYLKEEEKHLNTWLCNKYHAEMYYMTKSKSKRLDPRLLVPGAKSVIVVLLNYFPKEIQRVKDVPILAKYAYGKDYHILIRNKLKTLFEFINKNIKTIYGRVFCDSAPVFEHAWAVKAGLGWIGKNAQLINKQLGSFVFIGEIIIDLELEYDSPYEKELCGTCTKCIDACPTKAIIYPKVVDARKCISYLTIELRDEIPSTFKGKLDNRVFGCDVCQDVCPWNKKLMPHNIKELDPHTQLLSLRKEDWFNLTEEEYKVLFKDTPVQRIGYKGLKHNLNFVMSG